MAVLTPEEDANRALINDIGRRNGLGSLNSTTQSMLRGINITGKGNAAPINQDHQGFVFFTRPHLNLSTPNLLGIRKLHFLLQDADGERANTIGHAIRTLLDPGFNRLWGVDPSEAGDVGFQPSNSIDNSFAFIPILSNNLLTLSGWPDEVVEYFDSPEGIAKEVYGHADMRAPFYGTFDLSASFDNTEGDLITTLLSVVREYMGNVKTGDMLPYPYYNVQNIIDYNTRIYRLVTNASKTRLQKIACTGASMFGSVPTGAAFNYDSSRVLSNDNANIGTSFKCYGAMYNDPMIIKMFNKTVSRFKPAMLEVQERTAISGDDSIYNKFTKNMVRITNDLLPLFNYMGYPYINDATYEIEWWLEKSRYDSVISGLQGDVI